MSKAAPPSPKKFSVDRLMRNTSLALISDFRDMLMDPCFAEDLRTALQTGDVARIRNASSASIKGGEPAYVKAVHQLNSISKRYRYHNDIYSDSDLTCAAVTQFKETQSRLEKLDYERLDVFTDAVLDRASSYIARVLGEYSDEEHRNLCRFGSGASVGVSAAYASLAQRWEPPISGSQNQIAWFDLEMSQIPQILNYWEMRKRSAASEDAATYQVVDELKLVLVPKTFKAFRSIMPNTTIGSYMSYGIGEMIRKRLRGVGYDIRTLQERHKYLARQGSIHGFYGTADLSNASDSLTTRLIERLLPPDWFKIMNQCRIGNVRLPDGSVVQSETFCTMGIGYTFPLQTLVFLSLLKGIESCVFGRNDRRLISVYGDDMIYSPRMHTYVSHVFEKIGLILNVDKTYMEGHFRESCGGDYYRGVDVRPFQPRNGSALVGRKTYEATLYKFVNGLSRRWSECEIGKTLRYLVAEIEEVVGKVKIVPHDYPDDSGIRSSRRYPEFLREAKRSDPKFIGHGLFRFSYLRFTPEERREDRHEPYLWAALDGPSYADLCKTFNQHLHGPRARETKFLERLNSSLGLPEREPQLLWRVAGPIKATRSRTSGRRLRRLESFVTISHSGSYTRQSGTSCFDDRS